MRKILSILLLILGVALAMAWLGVFVGVRAAFLQTSVGLRVLRDAEFLLSAAGAVIAGAVLWTSRKP